MISLHFLTIRWILGIRAYLLRRSGVESRDSGKMLNSISRIAGTAGAAAVAVVTSASSALGARPELSVEVHSESRLSKPSSSHFVEEYDFCEENGSGLPSQEEVEAASRELQTAFVDFECSLSSAEAANEVSAHPEGVNEASMHPEVVSEVSSHPEAVNLVSAHPEAVNEVPAHPEAVNEGSAYPEAVNEVIVTEVSRIYARNPCKEVIGCSSGHPIAPGTRNAVAECVDLFQRNPEVQAAVTSLARDPAVWDAFVRNEKVQELLRNRNIKHSSVDDHYNTSLDLLQQCQSNPFLVAVHCLKNTVWEVMDSIIDVVHNVFGFLDRKIFGGRENEPLDRPLKACMVLTVLLFSLILRGVEPGNCDAVLHDDIAEHIRSDFLSFTALTLTWHDYRKRKASKRCDLNE